MLEVRGLDIRISQGDTATILIGLQNEEPIEGEAVITLKRNVGDRMNVWEKRVHIVDNEVPVYLESADTNLPARVYWWDVRLLLDGAVQTPWKPHRLEVMEAIGDV